MMLTKTRGAILLSLILILFLGLASAQTLIIGKVYNTNYGTQQSGANVRVNCEHSGSSFFLDTNSISDGTYAVVFDSATQINCTLGDIVKISSSSGSYSGEESGTILACPTPEDCKAIINVLLKQLISAPSGGGGGGTSGRYYLCGNKICDSGETVNNCAQDCNVTTITACSSVWECTEWTPCVQGDQIRNCVDKAKCTTPTNQPIERRSCEVITSTNASQSGFARITGAVVGALGVGGTIIAIAFIIAVIAGAALLFFKKPAIKPTKAK